MQNVLDSAKQLSLSLSKIYTSIDSPIAELQRTINQTLDKINLSPTIKALEQWQVQFKELQKNKFPNQWSDDPRYIVDLIKRIVRVSMETIRIVKELPKLDIGV